MEGRWGEGSGEGWVPCARPVQGRYLWKPLAISNKWCGSSLEAVSASDQTRLETTHGMEGGKGTFLHNVWFSTLQHGSQTIL